MIKLVLYSMFFIFIFGCSTRGKKLSVKDYKGPISIVVLPIINKSTAADAPNLYLSTLAEPLSNRGYYVYPIEITNQVFIEEGVTSGRQLEQVPVKRYKKLFGADAMLGVTIKSWDTTYVVIASNISVELDCQLISTKTGKVLWRKLKRIDIPIESQASSNNLLVNLIDVALTTAAIDYVSIARKLNKQIFRELPPGRYHIKYNSKTPH